MLFKVTIAMGKKESKAALNIFDACPNPSQTIIKGIKASRGKL
jgi:hypothetical protein